MLGLRQFQSTQVDLFQGDITEFVCDAMVNAANTQLKGGGGVDGAIHRVGGPTIMVECQQIGGCATGQAVVTSAGQLPAKIVIHAVGPVWQGGALEEAALLGETYWNSLQRAVEHKVRHVAFPSLSTGAYQYPAEPASRIALHTVKKFLTAHPNTLGRITFVLFSRDLYQAFQSNLVAIFPEE